MSWKDPRTKHKSTRKVCQRCRDVIVEARQGDPWPLIERIDMGWVNRFQEDQDDWEFGPAMETLASPEAEAVVDEALAPAMPGRAPTKRGRRRRTEDPKAMLRAAKIHKYLKKGRSQAWIAGVLGYDPSTISRYLDDFPLPLQ
jgi:hypothetical protein